MEVVLGDPARLKQVVVGCSWLVSLLARLHFVPLLVSDDNGREDYNGRNSLMLCDNK